MRQPCRFSEAGFESMKLGAFLLFGRTKRPDLHRTARPRFSPLSAGSSVLDALWIVAIILEQPAYALIVPSQAFRRIQQRRACGHQSNRQALAFRSPRRR